MPMNYSRVSISESMIPRAALPVFQHLLDTYASETNKVISVWNEFSWKTFLSARTPSQALSRTSWSTSCFQSGAFSENFSDRLNRSRLRFFRNRFLRKLMRGGCFSLRFPGSLILRPKNRLGGWKWFRFSMSNGNASGSSGGACSILRITGLSSRFP